MLTIVFDNYDYGEMGYVHNALVGYQPYIDSGIAITENPHTKKLELNIGEPNGQDATVVVKGLSIKEGE